MKHKLLYFFFTAGCIAWMMSCTKEQPKEKPVIPNDFQCDTLQNKCQNGGVCVNGTCNCPPHFTGERCETEITPKKMLVNRIVVEDYHCGGGIDIIANLVVIKRHLLSDEKDTVWASPDVLNNSDDLVFDISPPLEIAWDSASNENQFISESHYLHRLELYMKNVPSSRYCASSNISFKKGSPDMVRFGERANYILGYDSIAGYMNVEYIW